MTFLPIQFRTKIKFREYEKLTRSEILDEIENYLLVENFNYLDRKKDKIIFHKADGFTSFNSKSFLVSGIVKVIDRQDGFEIINGNWLVLLIAIPFIIIILVVDSEFSTINENDVNIIKFLFAILFGGNLIVRFFAHMSFKSKIKGLMKKYAQHQL